MVVDHIATLRDHAQDAGCGGCAGPDIAAAQRGMLSPWPWARWGGPPSPPGAAGGRGLRCTGAEPADSDSENANSATAPIRPAERIAE